MRQRKHIMAALLALCLLLTACGGKQGGGDTTQLSSAAAYTSNLTALDLPITELTASGAGNGSLYLAGREEDEADWEETDPEGLEEDGEFSSGFTFSTSTGDDGEISFYSGETGHAALYRMDAATGAVTKLEDYVPGEGASIAAIVPCEDGSLWVLEQAGGMGTMDFGSMDSMVNIASAGFGDFGGGSKIWRKLDATGAQELNQTDVSDLTEKLGMETSPFTRMDRADRLYAASGTTVTVLDTALSTLFTCKTPETVEQLISLGDGSVGVVTTGEAGRTVYRVDPDRQALGEPCPLTGSAGRIYAGNEKYDFLYNSGDSLYGWSTETGAPEKLLSWSGAGVDMGQITALALLPDGPGAAVMRGKEIWPVTYSTALLTPVSEEELSGRTVLTLATMGMDSETRAKVLEFNRTSGSCRIEVRDYSEYNTPSDSSAGISKLNTEILAGDMPDLLDLSGGIPLRQYAAKGLLEDLWPYIDADMGREALMKRVFEAAEIDGKLYRVFPRFSIETAAGNPDVVGNQMGWTLDQLQAAMAKTGADCSVLGPNETKSSILEDMFSNSLDSFVNWEAGTASFDSAGFQAILEFCNTFPSQAQSQGEEFVTPYTWVARGEQLLLPVDMGDLSTIQIYQALFGGDAAFVGYPSESGSGVRFSVEGGIAMSSSCKDKDGAWSFLRQALLSEGDRFTFGFPVNRANFEKAAQDSMEIVYLKDEDGNLITGEDGEPLLEGTAYVVLDTQAVMIKPPTQADYDQVMALYEAAEGISGRDENIWAIVQEGAGAYFAGDRTAEDAAAAIQNRVELYLNEQK